jgi:hypothetical protein
MKRQAFAPARLRIPFLPPVVPPNVFSLADSSVTWACVRRDPEPGLVHSRAFPYPPGSVVAGAAGTPRVTREAVREAVETARRLSTHRLTRASVLFPDDWARMLPVDFEVLPDGEAAAQEVVRWRVKKLLPGISQEMEVVHKEIAAVDGEGRRVLVAATPAETIRSIEEAFASCGVRVGLLAPSSLVLLEGLAHALAAASGGDWALLHKTSASLVLAVVRGTAPLFLRQRPPHAEDEEQEIRLTLSYYAEKIKGPGLSAVYVHDEQGGSALPGAGVFPVTPKRVTSTLLSAGPDLDERVASRPELLPAFAAVYGKA